MDGIVDMKKHIENKKDPLFYKDCPTMNFTEQSSSWTTLLNLIKSKDHQK